MPFSTTYANNILNWAFGKKSLSSQDYIYIGLCSNDPEADSGTFTELSGGAYVRVLIFLYNEKYPDVIGAASNREIKNVKQVNWPKATANWTQAKGFGLFTQETGGQPFFYGKFATPVTCESGAVMLFDPQSLKISFAATDTQVTETTANATITA